MKEAARVCSRRGLYGISIEIRGVGSDRASESAAVDRADCSYGLIGSGFSLVLARFLAASGMRWRLPKHTYGGCHDFEWCRTTICSSSCLLVGWGRAQV